MRHAIPTAIYFLLLSATTALRAADFDVKAFGATGDGHTLDTAAFNRAIEAAAAAGGGTVHVPPGIYASFSIHLRSHVSLYLEPGSTLLAAEPSADLTTGYDAPEDNRAFEAYQDFGHTHWHNSLLWGESLEDVSICGPGRIYGRGLSRGSGRRDALPEERAAGTKVPALPAAAGAAPTPGAFGYPNARDVLPAGVGNKAIALKNCRNVLLRDFTIYHGGHFAVLATGVDNFTCDNLKIDTNRDGIDFDCCQNVRVSNCTVNSPYDDGICPKSSFALGYNRPTENVTITNCQVSGYDEGTLLDGTRQRKVKYRDGPTGRIKCGTESNGGFRNITISNCVFEYSRGLALESVDGALMEDIVVSNLAMRDIVNTPIFIRLGARLRGPDHPPVGTARRILIDNVVAHNVAHQAGILIAGVAGHPVEDVTLSNIYIDYEGGGTDAEAKRVLPNFDQEYPEPSRFGVLPAWGLFVQHGARLSLHHVEFRAAAAEARPGVQFDDVDGVDFDHVKVQRFPGAPVIAPGNARNIVATSSPGLSDGSAR